MNAELRVLFLNVARQARRRSFALLIGFVLMGTLLAALLERTATAEATTRLLTGPLFGIAVPLVAFLTPRWLLGPGKYQDFLARWALWGFDRRRVALAFLAASCAISVAISVAASLFGLALTRGLGDPDLAMDLWLTAGIAVQGALAYTALVSATLSAGSPTLGPALFLGIDWLFGASDTLIASLLPRANLLNLLQPNASLLSARPETSSWLLLGLALGGGLLVLLRQKP